MSKDNKVKKTIRRTELGIMLPIRYLGKLNNRFWNQNSMDIFAELFYGSWLIGGLVSGIAFCNWIALLCFLLLFALALTITIAVFIHVWAHDIEEVECGR